MTKLIVLLASIALALLTTLGDFFLKKGSFLDRLMSNWWIFAAAIVYASTAFAWFFILKYIKLSSAVVIYSMSLLIFVVIISVVVFGEKINLVEYLGIALAIASIVLLYRFA